MSDVSVPLWAVVAAAVVLVLVLLVVVLLLVALGARRRTGRELVAAEASEAELRERLEALEKRLATPARRRSRAVQDKEYVITSLGDEQTVSDGAVPEVRTLTAPAFADAVFRETLVHGAALMHGVRRALSPEARYRIRYEMTREVKRQRKDRKTETREALREYRARQRGVTDDLQEESR